MGSPWMRIFKQRTYKVFEGIVDFPSFIKAFFQVVILFAHISIQSLDLFGVFPLGEVLVDILCFMGESLETIFQAV